MGWGMWLLSLLLVVLAGQSVLGAETAGRARKPKDFPAVPTVKGSSIAYGTVPLDTWTGKVAYLLFEGNSTSGYSRVFAWIPGDSRFGKPVEWKPKILEATPNVAFFGELENRDSDSDEKVAMNWRFTDVKQARGAGSDSVFDYVTGKTTTRNWGASTWHHLIYSAKVGYGYGEHRGATLDGGYPLELVWTDNLPLYDKWEKVPEPEHWFYSLVRAKHEVQETRDPKKGRLLCSFDGFHRVAIQKAPPELFLNLLVTPYLEPPVYSNRVPMADFIKSGFDLEVPYGWYSLRLSGGRYGRFTFGGDFHRININPIPISRPFTGAP